MTYITDHPLLICVLSFLSLTLSAWGGVSISKKWQKLTGAVREDFGGVKTATLTLLSLLIGFSFSMAVDRYNLRKNYEEAEANAIGTEYLRIGLLPVTDVVEVRRMLVNYLNQRILFYTSVDAQQIREIDTKTTQLQTELWTAVQASAAVQPTCVVALAVSGMNDVLNSQGYTQAAWWNRIPVSAWGLMGVIAIFCNLMVGYSSRSPEKEHYLPYILPFIISIAFFLIADIESPRGGLIRVNPQNLISLSQSLHPK